MRHETEAAKSLRALSQPLIDDGVMSEGQLKIFIDATENARTPAAKAAAARAFLRFQIEAMDLALSAAKAANN